MRVSLLTSATSTLIWLLLIQFGSFELALDNHDHYDTIESPPEPTSGSPTNTLDAIYELAEEQWIRGLEEKNDNSKVKAMELFEQAANQGDSRALYMLGRIAEVNAWE